MFKRILIPVDIAEPEISRATIVQASDLAKNLGRRAAACLHSIPGSGQFFRLRLGRSRRSVEARRRRPDVRTRQVEQYTQKRASTVVRFGAVLPEILAEAEWRADLIALGSHIPSIATYILGSNAAHIVRHAKSSVLVIR
jgi:nucleotide-binding universal stress UspA family protein